MTIIEAEKQYELDVQELQARSEQVKRKTTAIGRVVGIIFVLIGIVLLIVGATKEPIVYEVSGFVDNNNTLEYAFGAMCLIWGIIAIVVSLYVKKNIKINYLQANKNLYMNYIRCTDMSEQDREFYKQKLEEIRMAEIRRAVSNAGAAIIFSQLIK